MNGLTAKLGLELLGLGPGQTLGVTGGAGLLASYVIALAKDLGVRVIADAKPEDEPLVRSLGADVVVPRVSGSCPRYARLRPMALTASTTPRCCMRMRSARSAIAG
jgi:NADPH:quinone reductase-like Zn-dependent oxidoreductase